MRPWKTLRLPGLAEQTAANVLLAVGVLFLGWSPFAPVALYVLESAVIGLANLPRIYLATRHGSLEPPVYLSRLSNRPMEVVPDSARRPLSLILPPFFLVHYGFFLYIQSAFLVSFAGWGGTFIPTPAAIVDGLVKLAGDDAAWTILGFAAAQGRGLVHWLRQGRQRTDCGPLLVFSPYGRIFLQQAVVILGGGLMLATGAAAPIAMLLVALKIAYDFLLAARDPLFAALAGVDPGAPPRRRARR